MAISERLLLYAIVFFSATAIALLITPALIRFAMRRGIVDKPGARRVNLRVVSRFGGTAMFLGFAVSMAFVCRDIPNLPAILVGAAIMTLIGAADDMRGLPALVKLGGQVAAAVLVFLMGERIGFITNPFGGSEAPYFYFPLWLSFPLTVFWIVGITNTVNLIDGLDGLAAGIVCIASFTFFLVADHLAQWDSALLSLGLVGATAGFLRWNFYPAKTFMGDAGAYFLGYMVAVIAVGGAFKTTMAVTFLIPVLALGVPIFDTSFAILRRVKTGSAIMSAPDKGHVHHRLLQMMQRRRVADRRDAHRDTVIFVYLTTLGLSVVSLLLIQAWWRAVMLLCGILLLVPFLIVLGKLIKGRHHAKTKSV